MAGAKLDQITKAFVDQFASAEGLLALPDADRFERFVNFCVVSAEHSDSFDVEEISGPGDEVGIDGLAVLVNGALVTTAAEVDDLVGRNRHVEATFIVISAKRSPRFSEAAVGNLAFATHDFFTDVNLTPTDFIAKYLEIKDAVYSNSGRFTKGLPRLKLYYATSGKWEAPDVVLNRIASEISRLAGLDLFESVDITPLGAHELRDLYSRTQNPVAAEFVLSQKVTLPAIPGVSQAYLGVIPAAEYVDLITDEAGQIRKSLFTDNVRDYRGDENDVNTKIAETLRSPERDRFAVLNNGVTIVARELRVTGDKLNIEGYQVVNGGQTSHVLFNTRDALDETVFVPIRVIGTADEDLTTAVITATNSQTPVAAQELHSRSQFERDLEQLFATFTGTKVLFYERRSRQYTHVTDIEKVRIITRDQLVRSYAAMWMDEPHRATGYVPLLMDQLGERLLGPDQKLEPYYAAAFANYKLEFLWRNKQLESRFKPGRWQILMAARHAAVGPSTGLPNSKEAAARATALCAVLWDDAKSLALFKTAIATVDGAVAGVWKRDQMRNQPTTAAVLAATPASTPAVATATTSTPPVTS